MKVHLTTLEPMLGTASSNPNLYAEFIESKRPPAEPKAPEAAKQAAEELVVGDSELLTIPTVAEELQKSTTCFRLDPVTGAPFIYDYQIKGFFKDTCAALARVTDTLSSKVKAYKKIIDGNVFVFPRRIPLVLPVDTKLTICERPLRAQTPQGERVALARSDMAPAGTTLTFKVATLDPKLDELVLEWLDFGMLRGLGQWRNSGMGRFQYELPDVPKAALKRKSRFAHLTEMGA